MTQQDAVADQDGGVVVVDGVVDGTGVGDTALDQGREASVCQDDSEQEQQLQKLPPMLACTLCGGLAVGARLSTRCSHSFCFFCAQQSASNPPNTNHFHGEFVPNSHVEGGVCKRARAPRVSKDWRALLKGAIVVAPMVRDGRCGYVRAVLQRPSSTGISKECSKWQRLRLCPIDKQPIPSFGSMVENIALSEQIDELPVVCSYCQQHRLGEFAADAEPMAQKSLQHEDHAKDDGREAASREDPRQREDSVDGRLPIATKSAGTGVVDQDAVNPLSADIAGDERGKDIHVMKQEHRWFEEADTFTLKEYLERHAPTCANRPMACIRGDQCGVIPLSSYAEHLRTCPCAFCPNRGVGCPFQGTFYEIEGHAKVCSYAGDPGAVMAAKTEMAKSTFIKLKQQLAAMKQKESSILQSMAGVVGTLQRLQAEALAQQRERREAKLRLKHTQPPHLTMPFQFYCMGSFRGHEGSLWAMQSHKDFLYTSASDETVKVWDMAKLACIGTLEPKAGVIHCMCIADDKLFCGSVTGMVVVYSTDSYEMVCERRICDGGISCCASYGNTVYFGTFGAVYATNAALEVLAESSELGHWVREFAVVKEQGIMYGASGANIIVYSLEQKALKIVKKISTPYGSIRSLTISNNLLITGTQNQNIHIYDVDGFEDRGKLVGHVSTVSALISDGAGRFVLSAGEDRVVKIWDLLNGLEVQCLNRHEGSVNALAWHGQLLLSCGGDAVVKVYRHKKLETAK